MLFDLQSPRRRRVVRITFGALAGIFAISFVLLGVGTGGSGFSISDLFGNGGGGSSSSAFDDDIKAAEQKLAVNPNDTVALAQLVQFHYQAGVQDVNSDQTLTSDGEQQLRESADAWNKYVKLVNGKIDSAPALFALNTFDQLGTIDFSKARSDTSTTDAVTDVNSAIDDWKSAAQAQQALINAQPNKATANSYTRLASYLYLSGQSQAADQAAAKAKSTGGASASNIESQLSSIKQLGQQLQTAIKQLTKQQQQTQSAGGAGGATGGAGGATGGAGGGNPLNGLGTGGGL